MEIETIRAFLSNDKKFRLIEDRIFNVDLYQYDMEMWVSGERILVLKEYKTKTAFYRWLNEQAVIASVYQNIPYRYKNNLYFFIVLSFEEESLEIQSFINQVERNNKICRKYILMKDIDLEKIPFFNESLIDRIEFDYAERFKDRILKALEEKTLDNNLERIKIIINSYLTDNSSEEDLLKKGDSNEN
ncbi:hypothetical protein C1N83_00145 [Priestia aryabhattai]